MSEATQNRNRASAREYRLDELEREQDRLAKQLYRMALRHEDVRQELKDSRKETREHFDKLEDLLHSRFFWLTFAVLAGLCVLAVLVVDFRMDLAQVLETMLDSL